jgi:hypothetical protein
MKSSTITPSFLHFSLSIRHQILINSYFQQRHAEATRLTNLKDLNKIFIRFASTRLFIQGYLEPKGVQNVIDRGIQFFVNTNCKPDKDMNYTPIGIDPKKSFP